MVVSEKIGDIHVVIEGDQQQKNNVMVTLHDVGQNHKTCFQSFFSFHQFQPVAEKFTVYHLNFPGQDENASELDEDYGYPTMDEMACLVLGIFKYYDIKDTVCLGVGAGANVFTRLALKDPSLVECLVLIGGTVGASSWTEWGYEKMSSRYLKTKGMTSFCQDYLLWHFFGKVDENTNQELLEVVREQLKEIKHPKNLAMLVESYSKRKPIDIKRPIAPDTNQKTLSCGVLLISGAHSPALEDTIDMNSKLDPTKSSWMQVSDASSMVLDEKPTVVTSAIINFLKGYGYLMKLQAPTLPPKNLDDNAVPRDVSAVKQG